MQNKIITTIDEFYSLEDDWKELQQNDKDVTYYSTFEYIKTWYDVYKSEQNIKLFIVVLYENKKVICIAPLMIFKRKKGIVNINILKFLGAGDYLGVIIDRNYNNKQVCIKEIFKILSNNNQHFDKVELTHIKHNSELAAYLLKSDKYNKYFSYLIECPYVNFSKYHTFENYIKNQIKLSQIKYYINKLKKDTGYCFKVVYGNENNIIDTVAKLHKFEKQYLIKVKQKYNRKSLFEDERRYEYIKNLYSNYGNAITFIIEDKNGEMLIYYACYKYKNVLHFWNTAYNPVYEKYDLTKVLNYEIFKFIFENKFVGLFDYGAGRYPWKFKWTNDFIFNYQLVFWNEKNKKIGVLSKIYRLYSKLKKYNN